MLPTAYEVCEELVRTPFFVLSRGNRRSDLQPVLLKYPGATPFGAADELLLEREYALLHSLNCEAFQSRSNSFGVEASAV